MPPTSRTNRTSQIHKRKRDGDGDPACAALNHFAPRASRLMPVTPQRLTRRGDDNCPQCAYTAEHGSVGTRPSPCLGFRRRVAPRRRRPRRRSRKPAVTAARRRRRRHVRRRRRRQLPSTATACDTGNPGDCGAGHAVCTGQRAAPACPTATTQSCYDGPADTMGVGVCKAGMQTCIGSLGSCDGAGQAGGARGLLQRPRRRLRRRGEQRLPRSPRRPARRARSPRAATPPAAAAFSLRCPANAYRHQDHRLRRRHRPVHRRPRHLLRHADAGARRLDLQRDRDGERRRPLTQPRGANITASRHATFDCGTTGFTPGWWSQRPVGRAAASTRSACRAPSAR